MARDEAAAAVEAMEKEKEDGEAAKTAMAAELELAKKNQALINITKAETDNKKGMRVLEDRVKVWQAQLKDLEKSAQVLTAARVKASEVNEAASEAMKKVEADVKKKVEEKEAHARNLADAARQAEDEAKSAAEKVAHVDCARGESSRRGEEQVEDSAGVSENDVQQGKERKFLVSHGSETFS